MTGTALAEFTTELNGGASIGETLLFQLVNAFKAILEQERPWMVLRRTDTSKSVTTGSTWQTAIDLSAIERFSRFYGSHPVRLFGESRGIAAYRQVPFDDRLEHRSVPCTFVYDAGTKQLYLNGTVPYPGTLHIRHLVTSEDIAAGESEITWPFPSWSHPLLGFGAVAMHKGGVDYDEVNARQIVQNSQDAVRLLRALQKWDNDLQLSEREDYDARDVMDGGFRSGAINMHA